MNSEQFQACRYIHFQAKSNRSSITEATLLQLFLLRLLMKRPVISIDGSGDFTTTMIAIGKGNNMEVLDSVDFPHSMGIFYTAFTQFLGFPHYGDEYKVMGMAPYGEPKYVDKLNDVIDLTANGLFKLNLAYFRKGTEGVISYGDDNVPIVQPMYSDQMSNAFGQCGKPARN